MLLWKHALLLSFGFVCTALAADCSQQRSGNGQDGRSLGSTLLVHLEEVCKNGHPEFPPSSSTIATFSTGEMVWNITRSSTNTPLAECEAAFIDIIDQCELGGKYWGGSFKYSGATYTLSNLQPSSDPLATVQRLSLHNLVGKASHFVASFSTTPSDASSATAAAILLQAAVTGQFFLLPQ